MDVAGLNAAACTDSPTHVYRFQGAGSQRHLFSTVGYETVEEWPALANGLRPRQLAFLDMVQTAVTCHSAFARDICFSHFARLKVQNILNHTLSETMVAWKEIATGSDAASDSKSTCVPALAEPGHGKGTTENQEEEKAKKSKRKEEKGKKE